MEVRRIIHKEEEIVLPRPVTIPDECENINFTVFKSIVGEWSKDIAGFTEANKELKNK